MFRMKIGLFEILERNISYLMTGGIYSTKQGRYAKRHVPMIKLT